MLVRGYKGKEADQPVTCIDPGVVSLVAKLRAHERQAAEELEQWKTGVEERKVIDASPAAITLAAISDRRPRPARRRPNPPRGDLPHSSQARSRSKSPAATRAWRRSRTAGSAARRP
jgi:hypothetical protein